MSIRVTGATLCAGVQAVPSIWLIRAALQRRCGYILLVAALLVGMLLAMPARAATPQIVSGDATNCVLRQDGSVSCWGYGDNGQTSPPPGPFEQISLGAWSGCGLRASGQVECWGGQNLIFPGASLLDVPEGSYTQVSAGDSFHCAVRVDQKIVCWGGPLGEAYIPYSGEEDRFTKVSAGYAAFCGIRTSGALECGGFSAPLPPEGSYTDVVADKSRSGTFCAVGSDGLTVCWGYEFYGQTSPPPGSFVSVGIGAYHACGLRTNGTISCWGYFGNQDYRQYFPPSGQYTSLGVGNMHNCALRVDGAVVCWGINNWGEAPKLEIAPDAIPAAQAGLAYGTQLSMVDAGTQWTVTPYSPVAPILAIASGQLPAGISLSASGQLQGTTVATGTWPVTILGQDANGYEVERELAFTVVQPGEDVTPPQIEPVITGLNETLDWYRSDITLQWQVSDADSEVTAAAGCDTVVIDQDTPRPGTGYRCTATSTGGASTQLIELRRDATAPTIQIISVESLPDSLFTVHFAATDVVSDVAFFECRVDDDSFAFCDTWTSDTVGPLPDGPHTFHVRAVDNANNYSVPASIPLDATPDTTPPVIVPNVSGTLGNNGWYVSDVSIDWSVTDGQSAIGSSTGCEPAVLSTDSGSASFTCTASSFGGTAQESVTVKRDTGMPDTVIISAPSDPSAASSAQFEFGGGDSVSGIAGFACSLDGSAYATCTTPFIAAGLSGGPHTFAVRVVDYAGHVDATPASHAWTVQLPLDLIPPTATPVATPAANSEGWNRTNVTIAWNWSDAGSGINATQCTTSTTSSGEGVLALSAQCLDLAGNTGSASVQVRVDKTPPTLAPSLSVANVLLNGVVTATANGSDGLSGIATENCGPVVTNKMGQQSIDCVATDRAGNKSTRKHFYFVYVRYVGFDAPVRKSPIPNLVRSSDVVPLRFRLLDANGVGVVKSVNLGFDFWYQPIGCSGTPQRITELLAKPKAQHLGSGRYEVGWRPGKEITRHAGACIRLWPYGALQNPDDPAQIFWIE